MTRHRKLFSVLLMNAFWTALAFPWPSFAVQNGEYYINGNGTVFVIENGAARGFPDKETFDFIKPPNIVVQQMPPGVPTGPDIPSAVVVTTKNCEGAFSSKSCTARCISGVQHAVTWCDTAFGFVTSAGCSCEDGPDGTFPPVNNCTIPPPPDGVVSCHFDGVAIIRQMDTGCVSNCAPHHHGVCGASTCSSSGFSPSDCRCADGD